MLVLSRDYKFSLTSKLNSISWEWMSTRPRFEKYADDGSKMAYFQS